MNNISEAKPVNNGIVEQGQEDKWLDKQDILTRLHISGRTLQRWRTKKILPFTRIGKKIFYKEIDLKKILNEYQRR